MRVFYYDSFLRCTTEHLTARVSYLCGFGHVDFLFWKKAPKKLLLDNKPKTNKVMSMLCEDENALKSVRGHDCERMCETGVPLGDIVVFSQQKSEEN